MRLSLGVLMSVGSPWARHAAMELVNAGCEVHSIDFAMPDTEGYYLSVADAFQSESIALFRRSVAGCHTLPSRLPSPLRYVTSAPALRRLSRRLKLDALITLYGGGRAMLAYASGVRPYVVYVVGGDVLRASALETTIGGRTLGAAAIVFANGQYLGQETRRIAATARVVPLCIGVDLERIGPAHVGKAPVKLICTRGFDSVYNNEYLLHGLASLPRSVPEFEVVFVSGGPQLEGARSVARTILPPWMAGRVRFLGGVSDSELLGELQSSAIYVSLSRSDGTSISLLEALAARLFPVLSDIPQNREWVDGSLRNGILVPLDQPLALAEALGRAMSDGEWRDSAGVTNRALVVERADIRKNMRIVAATLAALTSRA